ncbi:MAG: hypothetical protein JJU15_14590 [Pararhodobacter sp.]|nr:hypothetical protein [Pararhodobacter sp.]
MSERRFKMMLAGALTATMLLTTPSSATEAGAGECNTLSANFVICPESSPWAEARWLQFGDGAALKLGAYWLEFSEDWLQRSPEEGLDEALDAVLSEVQEADREEGFDPPEQLIRDHLETEELRVVRALHRVDAGDGDMMLIATMIASSTDARILLMLGNDNDVTPDEMDSTIRDLISLIRPGQEG